VVEIFVQIMGGGTGVPSSRLPVAGMVHNEYGCCFMNGVLNRRYSNEITDIITECLHGLVNWVIYTPAGIAMVFHISIHYFTFLFLLSGLNTLYQFIVYTNLRTTSHIVILMYRYTIYSPHAVHIRVVHFC